MAELFLIIGWIACIIAWITENDKAMRLAFVMFILSLAIQGYRVI